MLLAIETLSIKWCFRLSLEKLEIETEGEQEANTPATRMPLRCNKTRRFAARKTFSGRS